MISEQYVSYEVAKLLKKKKFAAQCDYAYNNKGDYFDICRDTSELIYCYRPSLSLVMRWLREEKGLFVFIGFDDLDWNWQIFDIKNIDENLNPICKSESYGGIRSYDIAIEEAIRYCLEHLID